MGMKRSYSHILMPIAAAITIYGIVTGKFLFLLILLPLGFDFFRKGKDGDR